MAIYLLFGSRIELWPRPYFGEGLTTLSADFLAGFEGRGTGE